MILAASVLLVGVTSAGAAAAAPAQPVRKAQTQLYKVDCSISPDLCMAEPVARGCGDGRHWSSAGSGLAHCVDDDRDCADGKPGKRDEYDNLVCPDEKGAAEEAAAHEDVESAVRAETQQEKGKKK